MVQITVYRKKCKEPLWKKPLRVVLNEKWGHSSMAKILCMDSQDVAERLIKMLFTVKFALFKFKFTP